MCRQEREREREMAYLRRIGKWFSTAGDAEVGLSLILCVRRWVKWPGKDSVDLHASSLDRLLFPPSPWGASGSKGSYLCQTHRGVVRFYREGDTVGIPGQRNLHFVDVQREEARSLLASGLETATIGNRVETLLELVRATSSVERLLAAIDETRLDLI